VSCRRLQSLHPIISPNHISHRHNVLAPAPTQIFKLPDCTGNPFGFEVKKNNLDVAECAALTLPFVGNQADFMFLEECDICDRNSEISLSTSMPLTQPDDADNNLPLDPPADAERLDFPRLGGLRVVRTVSGDTICDRLGYPTGALAASAYDHYATFEDSAEDRYVWMPAEQGQNLEVHRLSPGESITLYETLWCNCRSGRDKKGRQAAILSLIPAPAKNKKSLPCPCRSMIP
jgi:hypothetical protein